VRGQAAPARIADADYSPGGIYLLGSLDDATWAIPWRWPDDIRRSSYHWAIKSANYKEQFNSFAFLTEFGRLASPRVGRDNCHSRTVALGMPA